MNELLKYQVCTDGGRVKSAGTSVDFILEQGEAFNANPGPESAVVLARKFHTLRDNPPTGVRNRFFPHDRGEIKSMTKHSPALFRPILKTDQGAGKFLPFTIGEDNKSLQFKVSNEEGYVIPEAHFQAQLVENPSEEILRQIDLVRENFRKGNLYETFLEFQKLETASNQAGYVFRRNAQVGRNALMFIHPAKPEHQIIIAEPIAKKIEENMQQAIKQLMDIAERRKKEFAKKHGLPMKDFDEYSMPQYVQADIHLFQDGDTTIAELQVPDVGMFLAGLPDYDNQALVQVKKIVEPLKSKAISGLERLINNVKKERGNISIFLVTRKEVVAGKEDVLEIRELDEVQKELENRGYPSSIISAEQAAEMDDGLMLIFNLDPVSEEFNTFAKSYLSDTERKRIVSPDPFFRIAEKEVTGYNNAELSPLQLSNFHSLVEEIEIFDKANKVYSQTMAIDYFLRQLGIDADVLHFSHPQLSTPIPAYRYDIRGLHLASNIIKGKKLQAVNIRSIPISKENGILKDIDGGVLYATFRFMFVKK